MMKYVAIGFPEIQDFMDEPDYAKEVYTGFSVQSEESNALYFVPEQMYNKVYNVKNEESIQEAGITIEECASDKKSCVAKILMNYFSISSEDAKDVMESLPVTIYAPVETGIALEKELTSHRVKIKLSKYVKTEVY